MQFLIKNKLKVIIVSILVLLLAGLTMFGFLGFNQTVDYRNSYEMQVGLDRIAGDSVEILKDSTNKALNENGLNPISCSYQEMNEGATLVYKFNTDVTAKIASIEDAVNNELIAEFGASAPKAVVKVYSLHKSIANNLYGVLFGLGLSIAIIFIYLLIINKLASAVASLVSIFGAVVCLTAILGLTRVPVMNLASVYFVLGVIASLLLSVIYTTKFKKVSKAGDRMVAKEVVKASYSSLLKITYIVACALALVSVVLACLTNVFIGLGVLVASISGIVGAVLATPTLYCLVNGKKKL